MASTRAQRRRRTIIVAILLAFGLVGSFFIVDVNRAAHQAITIRRSEDRSFGALANTLLSAENTFDAHLAYLETNATTLTRVVFAARLTQLANALDAWRDDAALLDTPNVQGRLNVTLARQTTRRIADYDQLIAAFDAALSLPNAINATTTVADPASDLIASAQSWNAQRDALAGQPGAVELDALTSAAASDFASALSTVRGDPALAADRGIGIVAVAVTPSPLPAAPGILLLPPVPAIHLGVSVTNSAYVDQPVILDVTLTPTNHLGRVQHQTLTTTLAPLASYAFVPKLLGTVASEHATLTITLGGAPAGVGLTRSRTYQVILSPSGN